MDLEQLVFGSATAASELLRSGQISSRDLTELALARIDAVNPSVNAVVELGVRQRCARRRPPMKPWCEASLWGCCMGYR
jgi:Asp-tRNA(Asn)/Glu-tRNA(Gln) amidotransferase A subunit family amidase